ncbi:MAG: toprim domain-containing protein, partial [Paludibacteraceae bacterium]|nr:toprim domain-containing protein [Paludibacteraceae bacterium]
MKVCIAEKPSVARDIARMLGATAKMDGYYEGNDYQVTWVFGHLCTLKEPHDYDPMWKQWMMETLPIIPSTFGIKLKNDKGVSKQFNLIKRLIDNAEYVVNCGDAGQEGELIQRWVLQFAKCKAPVYRLWISSLTDEAISQGFANLRPSADYDSLYAAGALRAIGDWLLGMNATRAYSIKYSVPGTPLSIGRVQTPTLAL